MKYSLHKKTYISLLTVLLVVGGVYGIYLRQARPHFAASQRVSPQGITHEVSLVANKAVPNELVIPLNDAVQFNSKDGGTHNIALGKGNDYNEAHDHEHGVGGTSGESGDFGPDEGYLVHFNKTGTYYFHDHNNPNIFISILVY